MSRICYCFLGQVTDYVCRRTSKYARKYSNRCYCVSWERLLSSSIKYWYGSQHPCRWYKIPYSCCFITRVLVFGTSVLHSWIYKSSQWCKCDVLCHIAPNVSFSREELYYTIRAILDGSVRYYTHICWPIKAYLCTGCLLIATYAAGEWLYAGLSTLV